MTSNSLGPVPTGPSDSVRIIEWPSEGNALEELAAARTPRLLVVDRGSEPPTSPDCFQDWMWRTGDEAEMRQRVNQLSLRALTHGQARPHLDSLGLLHVGLRSVHLPPKEQALTAVLLQRFNEEVSVEQLIQAAWPEGIRRPTVLAMRISALRSRLRAVGLEIRGSSTRGYVMAPQATAVTLTARGGFEDELEAARLLDTDAFASPNRQPRRIR